MPQQFVIWSEEHASWWSPGNWGYTPSLLRAARFSKEHADKIVKDANAYCQPPEFNEIAIPDPLDEKGDSH